ncbi:biotin--[acetyl-CoA-carboxylase] ligase [Qipengyuania nanhaisediminis]|uniref:biotin--[biotin carboxyl-carrier protein] ligase n=1 Tax=Qipengyuania nanhaisediminis TaxID=604088 RepID=A0A1I5MM62_9SPHN|nr:biotin--[acetyl-CoA-carboxylase] ligase [Qipengyuania nanhaisediminis]SFP10682.1 BirA family transcriptional regulator, biotin operon repressor / biotin-[acetyl-CoA-carboxylase] ligase [Qipengyuania nanhaisediminis]
MIEYLAETGSTNADLLERVRQGERVSEGNWLVAERQLAGKGRQGRTWFDGAGNFMGSTVVEVRASDPPPASLALVVGLAVYETVVAIVSEPGALALKWPNDLLLRGAKLAGILLEREGDAIVVGIGVNLGKAPDLPDRETIALSALGPAPDRNQFANSLARQLDTELERWRTFGLPPMIRRWELAAHALGTELRVQPPGEDVLLGAFAGLDDSGALQLRLPDGEVKVIHAGDVMLAREEG